jgi:hypothetical protein
MQTPDKDNRPPPQVSEKQLQAAMDSVGVSQNGLAVRPPDPRAVAYRVYSRGLRDQEVRKGMSRRAPAASWGQLCPNSKPWPNTAQPLEAHSRQCYGFCGRQT